MHYAERFFATEAGQKAVDRVKMNVTTGNNPAVEFYAITGFGARLLDVQSGASMSGEITPDERGFADGRVPPVANQPTATLRDDPK
jgi:hypothetical protein